MSEKARKQLDEIIPRYSLALGTKITPDFRQRYAELVAVELFEKLRPSLARARNKGAPTNGRLLERMDFGDVDVHIILEQLVKGSHSNAHVYDVAVALIELLNEHGEPLPKELISFAIAVLNGRVRRPPSRRGQNFVRDLAIYELVEHAQKADPKLHYQSSRGKNVCCCSVVAERIRAAGISIGRSDTDGYDTVEKAWKAVKKAYKAAKNRS